jgi:HSP20 family protein
MNQLIPRRGAGLAPLERMRSSFERLVDRMFGREMTPFGGDVEEVRLWDFDVEDTDKEVVVRAEIPGFSRDEIDISLGDNMLTIKAEKREKSDGQESYRNFYRSVSLPAGADAEYAQASYQDGVLELHLPKKPEAGAKRIAIQEKQAAAKTPAAEGKKAKPQA